VKKQTVVANTISYRIRDANGKVVTDVILELQPKSLQCRN
jgi:hypothetical protein